MSRFDYVPFDPIAGAKLAGAKNLVEGIEQYVYEQLPNGRATAVVLTKLEEVYMWMGKAIRDDQIAREVKPE